MNCKQGDLAVVVRSNAGNEGKIVRCVRLHSSFTVDLDGMRVLNRGPRWVIEAPLQSHPHGFPIYTIADSHLRPLRDPGEDVPDESTAWLPPVPLHDEVTA